METQLQTITHNRVTQFIKDLGAGFGLRFHSSNEAGNVYDNMQNVKAGKLRLNVSFQHTQEKMMILVDCDKSINDLREYIDDLYNKEFAGHKTTKNLSGQNNTQQGYSCTAVLRNGYRLPNLYQVGEVLNNEEQIEAVLEQNTLKKTSKKKRTNTIETPEFKEVVQQDRFYTSSKKDMNNDTEAKSNINDTQENCNKKSFSGSDAACKLDIGNFLERLESSNSFGKLGAKDIESTTKGKKKNTKKTKKTKEGVVESDKIKNELDDKDLGLVCLKKRIPEKINTEKDKAKKLNGDKKKITPVGNEDDKMGKSLLNLTVTNTENVESRDRKNSFLSGRSNLDKSLAIVRKNSLDKSMDAVRKGSNHSYFNNSVNDLNGSKMALENFERKKSLVADISDVVKAEDVPVKNNNKKKKVQSNNTSILMNNNDDLKKNSSDKIAKVANNKDKKVNNKDKKTKKEFPKQEIVKEEPIPKKQPSNNNSSLNIKLSPTKLPQKIQNDTSLNINNDNSNNETPFKSVINNSIDSSSDSDESSIEKDKKPNKQIILNKNNNNNELANISNNNKDAAVPARKLDNNKKTKNQKVSSDSDEDTDEDDDDNKVGYAFDKKFIGFLNNPSPNHSSDEGDSSDQDSNSVSKSEASEPQKKAKKNLIKKNCQKKKVRDNGIKKLKVNVISKNKKKAQDESSDESSDKDSSDDSSGSESNDNQGSDELIDDFNKAKVKNYNKKDSIFNKNKSRLNQKFSLK